MGQYFVLLNHSKREFVCPWCLGGTAKLWEWCAQPSAAALPYLLRKSTGLGGGDIADPAACEYAGRWAGDCVELVGDYDDSGDFETAFEEFSNISPALAAEYNEFIQCEDLRLRVGLCGVCRPVEEPEPVTVGPPTNPSPPSPFRES